MRSEWHLRGLVAARFELILFGVTLGRKGGRFQALNAACLHAEPVGLGFGRQTRGIRPC